MFNLPGFKQIICLIDPCATGRINDTLTWPNNPHCNNSLSYIENLTYHIINFWGLLASYKSMEKTLAIHQEFSFRNIISKTLKGL